MKTMPYALICSLFIFSGNLTGGERPPESEIQPVKPLSLAARIQKKEDWIKRTQEQPEDSLKLNIDKAKQFKSQHLVSLDVLVWTFYDEAVHWLDNVGVYGDWVKLEDGSQWQIALSDQQEAARWWYNDEIYISQSDGYYDYLIVNRTKEKHVRANRLTKPDFYGVYTRYIVAIDRFADRILLSDGTWWNVSWFDDSIMQRWSENHTVIIGLNCGFDKFSYPFILINVGIDTYDLGLDEWVSAQLSY